jgi:hypothetical protein
MAKLHNVKENNNICTVKMQKIDYPFEYPKENTHTVAQYRTHHPPKTSYLLCSLSFYS